MNPVGATVVWWFSHDLNYFVQCLLSFLFLEKLALLQQKGSHSSKSLHKCYRPGYKGNAIRVTARSDGPASSILQESRERERTRFLHCLFYSHEILKRGAGINPRDWT